MWYVWACFCTFEGGVKQIFAAGAEQRVGVNYVKGTQQQVIGVHKVITDHREVSYRIDRTEAELRVGVSSTVYEMTQNINDDVEG